MSFYLRPTFHATMSYSIIPASPATISGSACLSNEEGAPAPAAEAPGLIEATFPDERLIGADLIVPRFTEAKVPAGAPAGRAGA